MSAILQQLELNQSFFIEFIIFALLFLILSNVYFKPFMKLFHARHKRTVEDREAAEKLMAQAQAKFEEYQQRLADERANARKDYETVLAEARKEETAILAHARDEAKKITQEAAESAATQRDALKKQLENEIEGLANQISERLLSRKA